jgi:hypothetical protein
LARDHGQREKKKIRERERERGITLTVAQVLVWTAWQSSACAAGQRLPRVVFTIAHQEHRITVTTHTLHSHQRSHSKHRRGLGEASSRRQPATAKTEGKPPKDLPGEEAPVDSNWRRW